MKFIEMRNEMNETALKIETYLKSRNFTPLTRIVEECEISQETARWILEQMIIFRIADQDAWGHFWLTPEYKQAVARA